MSGWATYAFQLLNLGIIVWLFGRYFYPGVKEYLDRRSKAIVEELEGARKDRAEAQRLADEARKSIDAARKEAAHLLDESRREAGDHSRRMEEDARARSGEIIRHAEEQAQAVRQQALAGAQSRMADLALGLTRKVIASALDERSQQEIVDRALASLQSEVAHGPD